MTAMLLAAMENCDGEKVFIITIRIQTCQECLKFTVTKSSTGSVSLIRLCAPTTKSMKFANRMRVNRVE